MAASRYTAERKFVRYALDVRAKLSRGWAGDHGSNAGYLRGRSGFGFASGDPEGSFYAVEFELPTVQGVFRAEVQEKSRNGFRYGFRFVEVDESSMDLLRKYQRRWGILANEKYAARD